MEKVCAHLNIPTKSNRVDLGVRVELPAVIFSHLTDELYESKIVYRTEQFEDCVRTFCMNPNGMVVNENTNGIVTVNGHSYEGKELQTENTNFALLVAKHFSEPFKDSNGYGESIARLSNMLGGGVIVQRFGDLIRGRRSTVKRIEEGLVTPTLAATPGDLSLVLPKRILDGIIEMIYALDKIAPGTANDDTLLYGVEVKFYNMEVELDENLETLHKGLYIIGDGMLRTRLRRLCDRLGLSDRVIFTGNLSNPFAIMRRCDCFVFPSRYEGQGLVVLEARILGLPILVSNFSVVEDVCVPDGQLVVGMEEDDLYEGLCAYFRGEVPRDYQFDVEKYNRKAYAEFEHLFLS